MSVVAEIPLTQFCGEPILTLVRCNSAFIPEDFQNS